MGLRRQWATPPFFDGAGGFCGCENGGGATNGDAKNVNGDVSIDVSSSYSFSAFRSSEARKMLPSAVAVLV